MIKQLYYFTAFGFGAQPAASTGFGGFGAKPAATAFGAQPAAARKYIVMLGPVVKLVNAAYTSDIVCCFCCAFCFLIKLASVV